MFKKESCSLQKSGKQFKELNQKKVNPKTPSVPSSLISHGGTKHGRSCLGPRWETSPFSLSTKKPQKHHQETEDGNYLSTLFSGAQAQNTLQSISESVTSFSEGSRPVPAPPAIAARLLLQRYSHNSTAKTAMPKLCLHIRLMALHRELAPPQNTQLCTLLSDPQLGHRMGQPAQAVNKSHHSLPKKKRIPH